MMLPARRFRPALLCLALLCACGAASATDGRHMAADGSGSCPEGDTAAATPTDRAEDPEADPANAAAAARKTPKSKPAVAPRATGTRPAAPRWHSFLPGMFR